MEHFYLIAFVVDGELNDGNGFSGIRTQVYSNPKPILFTEPTLHKLDAYFELQEKENNKDIKTVECSVTSISYLGEMTPEDYTNKEPEED